MESTKRSGSRWMGCSPCAGFGWKRPGSPAGRFARAACCLFFLWVGASLLFGFVWKLTAIDVAPTPILLIGLGMVVLAWALRR